MFLHEAIEAVLRDTNRPMTATNISDEIDLRKLYGRGDNEPIPANQIHARVSNHPELFEREDGLIRLARRA